MATAKKKSPKRNADGTFKKKATTGGAKASKTKKSAPAMRSKGGGLGPLAARVSKLEKHQGQQDKAIYAVAEEVDKHERRMNAHDRALDELLARANEAGPAPGYRRFKVA